LEICKCFSKNIYIIVIFLNEVQNKQILWLWKKTTKNNYIHIQSFQILNSLMVRNTLHLFYLSLVALFCSLLFLSCAGQMAPTGGPADTTPPTIMETYPTNGTTHFQDNVFRIAFSEYVDKRSVDESIFLSPDLGELELDWSGTDVEIKFTDSLRANTTYVLTLGTDVKDLRRNVSFAVSPVGKLSSHCCA